MKHVEFLGVPGSGKSTVHRATKRALLELGVPATDFEDAILHAVRRNGDDLVVRTAARSVRSGHSWVWRRAFARSTDRFSALQRFLSANPRLAEVVLATQRHRLGRDLQPELTLSWILNLFAGFQLTYEDLDDSTLVLIDEGFCNRAISLFAYGYSEEDRLDFEEYLQSIPLADVVVVVETPVSLCERRLEERGWPERVSALGYGDRRAFMEGAAACVDAVADAAEHRGSRIVRVNGANRVGVSVSAVVDGLGL